MSAPTSALVDLGDVRLYTRSIGEGPDVVVLHGGPGAHHDYLLPQYDHLAQGRRLRYYDQRGGGQSVVDRQVAVGWQEQVADLGVLLDRWGQVRATLLGYSWGGLLAMLFAAHHPGRVARLALVSPAAATRSDRATFERRFAERSRDPRILQARADLARSGLRERDGEAYRRRQFELSVAPYFRNPADASRLTPFRVTARTQEAVWQSLGDYDITPQLEDLDVPALVLVGRHDPIPLESAERAARALRARLEILESSGHVPHVEETDRLVRLLDEFLPRS
ncbi:MAG TPA: alpha/beta hydrolase [Gemmatimonadales bacterium]|nr:alpha/beta hydrolase [Gemmatimonadales bacterium]